MSRTKTELRIRTKAAEKLLQNLKVASLKTDHPEARKILNNGIAQANRFAE